MGYAHIGVGFLFVKFFCLLFLLGIILFLVWAIRTLDKKQLKKWVIGLLVVGLLGMAGSSLFMVKMDKWDKDGEWWKLKFCEEEVEVEKEVETP